MGEVGEKHALGCRKARRRLEVVGCSLFDERVRESGGCPG
jgi:hypothetical protein